MRRNLWSLLGAAAGLALALFLLFTPVDRDSLFLDGVQKSAETAWEEALRWPDGTPSGATSAPQPLHVESAEIDPRFLEQHVVESGDAPRSDALRRDLTRGRNPEIDLLTRVRQALRAKTKTWTEEGAPAGARYFPVTWSDAQPHAAARRARLLVRPGFSGAPDASALELELAVAGEERAVLGHGRHAWARSSALWPPLVAVGLAVLLRRTITPLLIAVLLGCWLLQQNAGGFVERAGATAVYFASDLLWHRVLGEEFRIDVLLFVVFLGMAVGVMSRGGGIHGMVALLSRFAVGPRSTQLVSYVGGLMIFFDDYANCIILGNTMRPLTDRRGVSREKLSYIVDSTAAPVAAISIFSTWIAYEISMFAPQLSQANPAWSEAQGLEIFLRTLPYRFYCILTLVFIPMALLLRREFGPMLRAERRARHLGQPIDPKGIPMVETSGAHVEPKHPERARAHHAILPVLALILVTVAYMIWTGRGGYAEGAGFAANVRGILGEADSVGAILWASIASFALAVALAVGSRILGVFEALSASLRSAHSLVFAIFILIFAWGIGAVCEELETASYLVAVSKDWIRPELLPTVLFSTACMISFAIGSSWSTMAILLPNIVVLAWMLGESSALGPEVLLVLSIGAVLEGSIFGDHCSPISDTTVLSSMATASDHLDHVKTQAPYAIAVMVAALGLGYLPVALLGASPWLCLAISTAALGLFLLAAGGDPADASPEEAPLAILGSKAHR